MFSIEIYLKENNLFSVVWLEPENILVFGCTKFFIPDSGGVGVGVGRQVVVSARLEWGGQVGDGGVVGVEQWGRGKEVVVAAQGSEVFVALRRRGRRKVVVVAQRNGRQRGDASLLQEMVYAFEKPTLFFTISV